MYTSYAVLALVAIVSATPRAILRRAVNPALVPDFGVTRGIPTAQAGTCQGLNGATIPCFCPPNREPFIDRLNQYVDAGNAFGIPVSFPDGSDAASITAQNNALVVTLQNFNNTAKGVGCPQGAAVFKQGSVPSGDSELRRLHYMLSLGIEVIEMKKVIEPYLQAPKKSMYSTVREPSSSSNGEALPRRAGSIAYM
ncbi:MAG: hypothetical protein Q9191_002061 [Dirinaria sp. TL-2023a]